MEELQSTEILNREILESARKKAMRILKTSDDTIRAQTAEWESKTNESLNELEKKYTKYREYATEEIMARLPIDKNRAKSEKIESLLWSAVESWYAGLNRKRVLELITGELAKRLAVCEEFNAPGQKRAIFSALNRKEAEEILKSFTGPFLVEEVPSKHNYSSMILETENVRITASIKKTVEFLLEEKRSELIEALLGRELRESLQ